MRVLVIDDSPIVRARLVAMLGEVAGVNVDEAATADAALELARARAPELVVLDLHLPGRSGLAILRELKSLSSAPVVVVLTNQATEAHRRQCVAQGADHFFDKSHDFERVVALLRRPTAPAV